MRHVNKALYEDVKKVLMHFQGLPVWEVRLVLNTALEAIERHSYLDLVQYTERNEVTEED